MNTTTFVVSHEITLRLGFFLGVFAVMAILEVIAPRRTLSVSRIHRWPSNLGIVILNSALLRLVFPMAAVGMAALGEAEHWGLFNHYEIPFGLTVIISVALLDMVIYFQHVMFHAVPALWRLHRVHHADLDFDVTTGARFHPIEILLSMLIKFSAIIVLGAPVLAVILFEILLNATAMFNHSNVKIPLPVDRVLRWFAVTPDMHRVHHSQEDDETNSNFGFNLPWWDRLFGTYLAQPRAGHLAMIIGIRTFRDPRHCIRLPGMLSIPFTGRVAGYAINRRVRNSGNVDD